MNVASLIALGTLLPACSSLTPMFASVTARDEIPVGGFQVGTALVDITPSVGLGLFGHGPESRVAMGVRTRLQCQVFVFVGNDANARGDAPPNGATNQMDALALVACDLGQPSLLLEREVARRIWQMRQAPTGDPRTVPPLGADRIILHATHTHQGPAHYFAATNLSGVFSSRLLGRDDGLVAFMAERIAHGIAAAWASRGEATVAWRKASLDGLARNRDLPAFEANVTLATDLVERLSGQQKERTLSRVEAARSRAEVAIDREIDVLWIFRKDKVAGVVAVVGMHPTVMSNEEQLYGGDVFGIARRELREQLKDEEPNVVVSIMTGIEGDVTANVSERNLETCVRIGRELAQRIAETRDTHGRPISPTFRVGYRELDFSYAESESGHTCRSPELGTPAAGGGSDHPTPLRIFPALGPGTRWHKKDACHLDKVPLHGLNGPPEAGKEFPRHAPISSFQIGERLIVTVPGEMTVAPGLMLEQRVRERLKGKGGLTDVTVLGLAHEYMQYIASEDEYQLQHYEGASTLYGPNTATFVTEQHECLALDLLGLPCTYDTSGALRTPSAVMYDTGTPVSRFAAVDATPPYFGIAAKAIVPYRRPGEGVVAETTLSFERAVAGVPEELEVEVWRDCERKTREATLETYELSLERSMISGKDWVVRWYPQLETLRPKLLGLEESQPGKPRTFCFAVGQGNDFQRSPSFSFPEHPELQ